MNGSAIPRLPLVMVFLLLASSASPQSPDPPGWKGTREIRNGVVHVANPAEPIDPPVEYRLEERWRIAGETSDGTPVFGAIQSVCRDGHGNFLILDSQFKRVMLVDSCGVVSRVIGREGDGPGEFRQPTKVFVRRDGMIGILDLAAFGATYLTPEGEPQGEWQIDFGETRAHIANILPLDDVVAVLHTTRAWRESDLLNRVTLQLFSAAGDSLARLFEFCYTEPRERPFLYNEEDGNSVYLLASHADGRIAVSPSYTDYLLHIYDSATRSLRMIVSREYLPLQRTPDDMDLERAYWEGVYGGPERVRADVSGCYRAISAASYWADGTLWVTSSRGWKQAGEDVAACEDVFDVDGRYLHQAVIRGALSGDDDLVFELEDHWVVVTSGVSLGLGAMGAVEASAGTAAEQDPAIICYRLARIGAGMR